MDERGTIDGGRQAGGPDVAPEDETTTGDGADETADGRRVGLGHVIEDHLVTADPEDPDGVPSMRDVTDESEQSFPASDPPGATGAPTPKDHRSPSAA